MNVAIYVRVSTIYQAEQGYSIDAQLEDCRKKAADLKAVTIDEYIDRGKSGAFLERPGLQNFFKAVEDGKKYNALIIYKLDRLSRDNLNLAYIVKFLTQNNIDIILTDGGKYGSSSQDVFTLQVLGAMAQLDNAQRKERSIRGKMEKRKQGKIDKVYKYGYIYNDKKQNFDINNEEAITVKEIFRLFTEEHLSAFRIARKLNLAKVPPPTSSSPKRKDNHIWNESTIRSMMSDETYAGIRHTMIYKFEKIGLHKMKKTIRPREEWISVPVPNIISRETWDKAIVILKQQQHNPRRTKRIWLLQGLVYCNRCGQIMNLKQTINNSLSTKENTVYRFYFKCRSNILKWFGAETVCNSRSVSAFLLEDLVWNTLLDAFYSKETLEKFLKSSRSNIENNAISLMADKLTRDRTRLINNKNKIVDWFLNGKIDQKLADEKIDDLSKKINDIEDKLKTFQKNLSANKPMSTNKLFDIFHRIKNPNREEKKEIIQAIVNKIYVERIDNTRGKKNNPKLDIRIILN